MLDVKPIEWQVIAEARTLKGGHVFTGVGGYAAYLRVVGDEVIPGGIETGMHRLADSGETWMKANAPWTDRTGDARKGLRVDVEREGDTIRCVFRHTVDYGFWLENRWNGRFAVIGPAQAIHAGRAMDVVSNAIVLDLRGKGSPFRHRATGRFT